MKNTALERLLHRFRYLNRMYLGTVVIDTITIVLRSAWIQMAYETNLTKIMVYVTLLVREGTVDSEECAEFFAHEAAE